MEGLKEGACLFELRLVRLPGGHAHLLVPWDCTQGGILQFRRTLVQQETQTRVLQICQIHFVLGLITIARANVSHRCLLQTLVKLQIAHPCGHHTCLVKGRHVVTLANLFLHRFKMLLSQVFFGGSDKDWIELDVLVRFYYGFGHICASRQRHTIPSVTPRWLESFRRQPALLL